MAKTSQKADTVLRAEIERQLGNVRESMALRGATRDQLRVTCQQRRNAHLTLSNFTSHASEALICGLALYVVHGDLAAATRQFSEYGDWFVFYDDILEAAHRGELAGLAPRLPLRDLLEPTLCMVLADDRARLARLTGPELEQIFVMPQAIPWKYDRTWAWFTYALLQLARGKPPLELAGQSHPMRPKDVIEGYDVLLREAIRGDAAAFEAQRMRLDVAYPERSKSARSSVINWYGAGRIGQAMTFDVIGTVVTCLAVRAGLDLKVDSALYPAGFIHRA